MKKIMFIIAATLLSIAAQAQTDTLRWGQHDPTYYYYWPGYGPWVDQWTASYISSYETISVQISSEPRLEIWEKKEITLRSCYTDRPLSVIGVAAAIGGYTTDANGRYWDTSSANCPPESFVLYGRKNGRPAFIDSACWTSTTPRYQYGNLPTMKIYEAYFDREHTVMDTFYVGMTHNYGYYTCGEHQQSKATYLYLAHPHLIACYYTVDPLQGDSLFHKPAEYYTIPQMVYPDSLIDIFPDLADTAIHDRRTTFHPSNGMMGDRYPCVFPIIDTTGVNFDDLYERWDSLMGIQHDCPRVSRLRPEGLGHGCVNMAWRGDSCHAAYQLKYGKFFDPEEDYRQYDVTGNNIYIDVDSNVLYKVMVRGRCGCGLEEWSPWVSTMFLLTAYNATVVDSNQLRLDEGLEMLTTVSPNPAHGKATVFSSLHIRSIDVYSADGHRLDHINVGGLSHELDLSRYAKGLCLLKINTYRGTTVRKLIVE